MNVIGIDLGSRENKIGFFEQTGFQIIANEFGNYSTPSYICFQNDGEHFFGKQAQQLAPMYPKDTIYDTKRMLGRKYSDLTEEEIERWPFMIRKGENDNIIIVTEAYGEHTPVEITGLIIKDLLQIASNLGKETDKVVITVPAYYKEDHINDVKEAAIYAGIQYITLVSEPLSAAIWYSFWLSQIRNDEDERDIILLDMGAETFNFCGLCIDQTGEKINLTVKMSEKDLDIGGIFFDQEIKQKVLLQFEEQQAPLSEKNKIAIQKLCEDAKKNLVISDTTQIECEIDDKVFTYNLTRNVFKDIVMKLFKYSIIIPKVQYIINNASKKGQQFDLLFFGGSSYSPIIQETLGELIGEKIQKQSNPEEFVIKGACLYAAHFYFYDKLAEWKKSAQVKRDSQRYKTFDFIEKMKSDFVFQKNLNDSQSQKQKTSIAPQNDTFDDDPYQNKGKSQNTLLNGQNVQDQINHTNQNSTPQGPYSLQYNPNNINQNTNAQAQNSHNQIRSNQNPKIQDNQNQNNRAYSNSNGQKRPSLTNQKKKSSQNSPKKEKSSSFTQNNELTKKNKVHSYTQRDDIESSPSTESLIPPKEYSEEKTIKCGPIDSHCCPCCPCCSCCLLL